MSRTRSRWWGVALMGSVAIGLMVAPGLAGAGSGAGMRDSGMVRPAASEDLNLQRTWVELFNGRRWDELGGIYEEDAILIPPNQKPVLGRAAIIEYLEGIRDAIGEVTCGEPVRVTTSGELVAAVGDDCSARSGAIRANTHELYARQSDGSLRYRFDMFAMQ